MSLILWTKEHFHSENLSKIRYVRKERKDSNEIEIERKNDHHSVNRLGTTKLSKRTGIKKHDTASFDDRQALNTEETVDYLHSGYMHTGKSYNRRVLPKSSVSLEDETNTTWEKPAYRKVIKKQKQKYVEKGMELKKQ